MGQTEIKKLQANLKHPILIKKKENLFYLTGRPFDNKAEEYLLITKKNIVGFGSGLEKMDWVKKVDRLKNIGRYVKPGDELGIEYGFTYGEGKYLRAKVKGLRAKAERSPVDVMRQVKGADEIEKIRKSMGIVEKVFGLVRREIKKSGMTELKLAQFIQKNGLRMGAEDVSFPAIVASGANAAVPHHVPSNKKLTAGESIIIDFGFKYKHYCSDFTRTVFLSKVPKKLEIAYNQVEKAYNESMDFISSGQLTGNDVYQKAVSVLAEKNLDKYFIHSLGHGTGLEIHELPNLSPGSADTLKDGMVFSIEPGVYMPKVGGVRIEDLAYVIGGKTQKFIEVPTQLKNNIF